MCSNETFAKVNTLKHHVILVREALKAETKSDMSFESSDDLQQTGSKLLTTGYKSKLSAVEVLIYQTFASLLQKMLKCNNFLPLLLFCCSILGKKVSRQEK